MRAFSFVIALFVFVCGDLINLTMTTHSNSMIAVIDIADKGVVGRSVDVLVGNKDLYDDSFGDKEQLCQVVLTNRLRIDGGAKGSVGWTKIITYPTRSHSLKMTSANTDIFATSRTKCCGFPNVFHTVIPSKLARGLVIGNTEPNLWRQRGVGVINNDRSLVDSKIDLLGSELSLHRAQLHIKYASGKDSAEGGDNSRYAGYFSPASQSFGYTILAFFVFSALVCGFSAYYLDENWPSTGWIPLAILAVITAICMFQFFRLA
jgi:hypothetical protein